MFIYILFFPLILDSFFIKNDDQFSLFLKIDKYESTIYEYHRFESRYKGVENSPIKEFFKNGFYIADAYELGFDTLGQINNQVKIVSNIMMVQAEGYLWKHKYQSYIDSACHTSLEKLKKRRCTYNFEHLFLKDTNEITNSFNNQKLTQHPLNLFDEITSRGNDDQKVIYGSSKIKWPFGFLYNYRDELLGLQLNESTNFLETENGFFVLKLKEKTENKLSEKEAQALQDELKWCINDSIYKKEISKMRSLSDLIFNEENLIIFLRNFRTDLNSYKYPKFNYPLVEYEIEGKKIIVLCNEFYNYIIHSPYPKQIRSIEELKKELTQYYYNAILIQEAKNEGLYQNKIFLLDKKFFKDKLLLNYYKKNIIDENGPSNLIKLMNKHKVLINETGLNPNEILP